ncbi:MAG: hypothetical protein HOO96_32995 [Polyangiaceae bacterium]|nr:hypothetical protein [Polyangiaceae bacterium]
MKRVAALALALGTGLVVTSASATPPGPPGYTGKPNLLDPSGAGCTKCHGGGPTPTLSLTGPDTLPASGVGTYTLKVAASSGTVRCMVAATDLAELTPMSATVEKSFDELTPAPAGGGTCVFQLKAPAKGPLTIWYAGASMNGRSTSGDGYASAKRDITVVSSGPSDAGPKPTADGGAQDGGAEPGGDAGTAGSSGSSGTGSSGSSPSATNDDPPGDGGCASAPSPAPSMFTAGAVASLLLARRRRR